MSQPFSRHIETVPARRVNAPPFDGELARFERDLPPKNRTEHRVRESVQVREKGERDEQAEAVRS